MKYNNFKYQLLGQLANRVEHIGHNSKLVHFLLHHVLLGLSSVKSLGKDFWSGPTLRQL